MKNQQSPVLKALASLSANKLIQLLPNPVFTFSVNGLRELVASPLMTKVLSSLLPSGDDALFGLLFGPFTNLNNSGSHWQGCFPNQTPAKNLAHWVQACEGQGIFSQYSDQGNGVIPYDLTILARDKSVQLAIIYGDADLVADALDHQTLIAKIGGVSRLMSPPIVIKGFAHLDFTYAYNAATLFHPKIFDLLV